MADKWNDNMPAMGNQISADVPDIEENFGHIQAAFQRIFETWSTANGGNAAAKFESSVGFNDGTYNYEFPTNGVAAHSVIMLGTSDTIVWMYLNAAPPGWKALSTGADTVLGVSGGTGDYNVNGGNPDSSATWEISGLSTANESSHTHTMSDGASSNQKTDDFDIVYKVGNTLRAAVGDGTGVSYNQASISSGGGSAHSHTASSDGTWRASASVGKLFQLDTA